jgi:hypothetical protein
MELKVEVGPRGVWPGGRLVAELVAEGAQAWPEPLGHLAQPRQA